MNRHRTIIVTATALAIALSVPATVSAEPSPEAAVRLEIDVAVAPETSLPEDDETWNTLRSWVNSNQTTVLEGAGFVVSDDAPHVLRTEISVYGEYGVNTKGKLTLVGDDGPAREFVCEMCKDSDILKKIDDETAVLTERLRVQLVAAQGPEVEPAPKSDSTTAEKPEDDGEQAASDGSLDRPENRLGVPGYTGIGAMAVGLGVTLGGFIVLAEGPRVRIPPEDTLIEEVTSRRPLGVGLTAGGASLLAAGVVLVVLDQTVLRKRRAKRNASAVLHPSISPAGFGASLTGRF